MINKCRGSLFHFKILDEQGPKTVFARKRHNEAFWWFGVYGACVSSLDTRPHKRVSTDFLARGLLQDSIMLPVQSVPLGL